jgi:hypothetical protein
MSSVLHRGIEIMIEAYRKEDREIDRHLYSLVEDGVMGMILREYLDATEKRVSAMRDALERIALLLEDDE